MVAKPDDGFAGAAAREDDAVLARALHDGQRQKGIYGTDIVDQNNLFRAYALGNVRELTHQSRRSDPAMLQASSTTRAASKRIPTKTYARELMELFTLGIGQLQRAATCAKARALSPAGTFQRQTGQFFLNARQHDDGDKTFLGQSGDFSGDDIVDIIFRQPACAAMVRRQRS